MPDITNAKGSDHMKYGLFGATGYDTNRKLVRLWCWIWNSKMYT